MGTGTSHTLWHSKPPLSTSHLPPLRPDSPVPLLLPLLPAYQLLCWHMHGAASLLCSWHHQTHVVTVGSLLGVRTGILSGERTFFQSTSEDWSTSEYL